MLDSSKDRTIRQTLDAPLTSIDLVKDHASSLAELVTWDALGVLFDQNYEAVVITFLENNVVIAASRICLPEEHIETAMNAYAPAYQTIALGCREGHSLAREEITDLSALTENWLKAQKTIATSTEVATFYQRVADKVLERGRAVNITKETSRRVWFESHGRCMFEGCGKDLTLDPQTGQRANFAYEAHNVAASESGPRGIMYLSSSLANDPNNILLLCDIHHRLVDGIAKADYPAERLTDMRQRFCNDANTLLDVLQRPCIPAFCISWPVHRQVISAPSDLQIAQALMPIGVRIDGQLRRLNDNEKVLRDLEQDQVWLLMPKTIDNAANDILAQTHTDSYRAALFAMGLMPALIALGAKLGNKNEITPMLRDRESGLWYWPKNESQGTFYKIEGLSELGDDVIDVTLELAFTSRPKPMIETTASLGYPVVSIIANEPCNGSLAHPVDGYRFRQHMQELMHTLSNNHGVNRVHLLPCASNAACIFFGQAFDSYHPELYIYDFVGSEMCPRLKVHNEDNACVVSTINPET